MASIFETYVNMLLKEMNTENLKPIMSMDNASKMQHFNLIKKKKKIDSTKKIELNILTLLKGRYGMDVDVNFGLDASMSVDASKLQQSSLNIQFVRIPPQVWKDLQERKTLEKEPSFLTQCRKRRENLYVVTEILILTKKTTLHEIRHGNATAKCLKFTSTKLTLPKGTVMAYRRKQLVLSAKGWDFQYLQEKISNEMEALATYPKNLQDTLFQNILAMLGDRGALQNLIDMLENPSADLDGPGSIILNELRKHARDLSTPSEYHIICVLDVLMALSNTQRDLLATSIKMRILVQQRELVRSILEPHFMYTQSSPFTLPPDLLTPLGDEGVDITYGLLQECGLPMEPDSPASVWDAEVKGPLSVLYGAISLLQQLADP
ncbi:PREDICTED: gasdermin-C-like [Elephantulus edwardii]|uniref:gasdermin-C-like n=1 Tax=Elephantulus edwardii TaxID=28737 RepID=UPI0003F0C67B|nr:PREDICTED: gasdermin-C-like [Elephantulus edwardii]